MLHALKKSAATNSEPARTLRVRAAMKTTCLALLLPVLLLGGCRRKTLAPTGAPTLPGPPASAATSPLTLTLSTDKAVYKRGEEISLTLIARSTAKTPVPVTFTSGQSFDVEAQSDKNQINVWRWSAGQMFAQMMRSETWAPNEAHRYSAKWNARQATPDGEPGEIVAPGRYVLRARLTGTSPDARPGGTFSAPITIEIAP